MPACRHVLAASRTVGFLLHNRGKERESQEVEPSGVLKDGNPEGWTTTRRGMEPQKHQKRDLQVGLKNLTEGCESRRREANGEIFEEKDKKEDEQRFSKSRNSSQEEEHDWQSYARTSNKFIDSTKNGILARRLQEEERRLGGMTSYRIRIAESAGMALSRLLPSTNP